jgi:hypothetical protein
VWNPAPNHSWEEQQLQLPQLTQEGQHNNAVNPGKGVGMPA